MKLNKKICVEILEQDYMTGRRSLKLIAASLNCTPQRLNQIGIEMVPGWRTAAAMWKAARQANTLGPKSSMVQNFDGCSGM